MRKKTDAEVLDDLFNPRNLKKNFRIAKGASKAILARIDGSWDRQLEREKKADAKRLTQLKAKVNDVKEQLCKDEARWKQLLAKHGR